MKKTTLEDSIELIIDKKASDKINYLCEVINVVEWSGVLFYKVEGTIKDPKNCKLHVMDILLMDKGSPGYTEYSFDSDVVEYIMEEEERMEWRMGHIHSHNSMEVFFSATDIEELEDNSPNHAFYLSLIVNNAGDRMAKVSLFSKGFEVEANHSFKDENNISFSLPSSKQVFPDTLFIYNCKIVEEIYKKDLTDEFIKRANFIIDKFKTPTSTTHWGNSQDWWGHHISEQNRIPHGSSYSMVKNGTSKSANLSYKPKKGNNIPKGSKANAKKGHNPFDTQDNKVSYDEKLVVAFISCGKILPSTNKSLDLQSYLDNYLNELPNGNFDGEEDEIISSIPEVYAKCFGLKKVQSMEHFISTLERVSNCINEKDVEQYLIFIEESIDTYVEECKKQLSIPKQ